ncbi:RNA polymerase sigma factor RpoE [Aquipluma nitroreducens]|uniref:RNA polymerase sigma factor RpoE n=2 Tax=Aquipluma nitroreducens TaxID=2010828 RepID=A0A5K7SDI5_9BACT|nr:RNA polymerase sigma factor RpoE [Aquipluma nitroreducens]
MNEIRKNMATDQYLVGKVLDGDTNAFATIIQNTEGLVTQIVFKMISRTEDRKDIAQDIYLKAFKSLPGFRYQSKLSTWIAQIAYNTCLTYLEKKKLVLLDNRNEHSEPDNDSLEFVGSKSVVGLFNQTENDIFQRELNEILKSEIELLSPLHKTLITLYHNEELSYEEIARITQLPEGTVKSYLFRARRSLKDSLLRKYKKEEL